MSKNVFKKTVIISLTSIGFLTFLPNQKSFCMDDDGLLTSSGGIPHLRDVGDEDDDGPFNTSLVTPHLPGDVSLLSIIKSLKTSNLEKDKEIKALSKKMEI